MNIPIVHFNDVADGEPPSLSFGSEQVLAPIDLDNLRVAQRRWAAVSVQQRVRLLRSFRHALVEGAAPLVRAMNPRDEAHAAEILSSQVIPLADACRFLEREAAKILRPRPVGRRGRPVWLGGADAKVLREPCGVVLVVAPSNYPLFLPGVVVLQALVAGNAVVLKPGPGGTAIAQEFLTLLHNNGIDRALTVLLSEHEESVESAFAAGVDKLVFTGSARTGRKLLAQCSPKLVPAIMELSGSDAMFVRADADVPLAARALLFGLRLNRGATCIAPRRVFVHESRAAEFEAECVRVFAECEQWTISAPNAVNTSPSPLNGERAGVRGGNDSTRLQWKEVVGGTTPQSLSPFRGEVSASQGVSMSRSFGSDPNSLPQLIVEACTQGARLIAGEVDHHGHTTVPLLVADATPSMRLLREDHFSSVAAIVRVRDDEKALAFNDECPYALGASIFSRDEMAARDLASRVNAGSVVINDVVVPTADPRLPFGGRKHSGFGVTRGAEGLIELTLPKVVTTRRGTWRPHFAAPRADDAEFFTQFLALTHAPKWSTRFKAARAIFRTALARRKE